MQQACFGAVCMFHLQDVQNLQCSRLPLVTFDIAAIVCDGSNNIGEEKKGGMGERRIPSSP